MTDKTRLGLRGLLVAGAITVTAAMPIKAYAETTYNLALLSDFSGPYADIMPILAASRETVFDWWNETSGQELGVTLNYKNYETRYDAAQVASLWPGIKSELDPIAVVGRMLPPCLNACQKIRFRCSWRQPHTDMLGSPMPGSSTRVRLIRTRAQVF